MTTTSRQPAVFSPEAVASINRAYAEALRIIGANASQADIRSRLAATMMNLARAGERDERRLRDLSVEKTLAELSHAARIAAAEEQELA